MTEDTLDLDHLENRVHARLSGRVCNLRILFNDCGIILRGFARTYHAKQLAQHAVMAETHLPIVANEIGSSVDRCINKAA